MTAKANHSIQLRSCPSPLVLFGIDNRGKPKAARFGREHASLAIKAATQLQLNVLASNDPKVADIAARLPAITPLETLDASYSRNAEHHELYPSGWRPARSHYRHPPLRRDRCQPAHRHPRALPIAAWMTVLSRLEPTDCGLPNGRNRRTSATQP